MPVSGEYTWNETESHIEVAIPLKGVSSKKVDVFTASTILKVSYAPFLLDLNLHDKIDEESSRAVLKNGTLKIRLAKEEIQPWGRLCFKGSKEEIKQRRRKALADRDIKVQKQMEKVASKKVEEERMVFRQHMALEEKERQRMDDIKAMEKKRAEDAVYDTFSKLRNENLSCENSTTKSARFKFEGDMPAGNSANIQSSDETSSKTIVHENHEPQDCKEEDEGPEPEMPPPRKEAHLTFRHTPRLFKTPSRESTIKQEQEFIIKNRSNLKKNALLNHVDIGDADPTWLSKKGDEFYGNGDFCSAVNAYSEALESDETLVHALANRAACYLHLREGSCCIQDCSTALSMNDAIESQCGTRLEQTQFRKKAHIRLALAYCLTEEYKNSMEHFTKARVLDEDDGIATENIRYLKTLMEANECKADADSFFAKGDLAKAKGFYTQAISIDSTFVKALMNRSACHLAMENVTDCIVDCSRALELISQGKPKRNDSCLLRAIISPKPSVQRKWAVTLLCRRAAAKRLMDDLQGALDDLEHAKNTKGRNDDIDIKQIERSIEGLKRPVALPSC